MSVLVNRAMLSLHVREGWSRGREALRERAKLSLGDTWVQ